MKPPRKDTSIVLIDIQYDGSLNAFEEFYGENVSYQELEQSSYVEFKDLIFRKVNKNIKFRKHERIGKILTLRAYLLESELRKISKILERGEIILMYGWIVSNITKLKGKLLEEFKENNTEEDINL